MPDSDRRQQTLHLIALRDVDDKRAEAQKLIDAVPRILAARYRESDQARHGVAVAKERLLAFKTHLKHLELELASREAALQKANGNLLTAKTNQEYTALMSEIQRKREEKGEGEEAVLEQYEVIKQGERMVVEAGERLELAEKEYQAFEKRARQELAEHQKELAQLDERREQVRRAIDPAALSIYDRAYTALGTGLVSSEGNICQGCFSSLTPNDRSRLLSARELVICRSCQRILYSPEVIQSLPQ